MRPTEPGAPWSYDGAAARSFAPVDGAVRVWWVETGSHAPELATSRADEVPDSVARVAEVAEAARFSYRDLGYRDPLSDGDSEDCGNGGDERIDIYLFDFGSADGSAQLSECQDDGSSVVCAGFLLVENDFDGGPYASFDEGVRTVVPHEYFHLVQAAYDAELDAWWNEGTAQWAAKHVYLQLTDLERFLPAYFSTPSRPLDAPPGGAAAGFLYGTAIWPVFLEERFGESLVRSVFEFAGETSGSATAAIDPALADQKSSLADAFVEFTVWNAGTGSRAGSSVGYSHAVDYPDIKVEPFPEGTPSQVTGVTSSLGCRYYGLSSDQALRLTATFDPDRTSILAIPVFDGVAQLDRAEPLPATVEGDGLVLVAGRTTLKSDAPFVIHADQWPVTGNGGATGTDDDDGVGGEEQVAVQGGRPEKPGGAAGSDGGPIGEGAGGNTGGSPSPAGGIAGVSSGRAARSRQAPAPTVAGCACAVAEHAPHEAGVWLAMFLLAAGLSRRERRNRSSRSPTPTTDCQPSNCDVTHE